MIFWRRRNAGLTTRRLDGQTLQSPQKSLRLSRFILFVILFQKLHPEHEEQHFEVNEEAQPKNINGGPIAQIKLTKDVSIYA